VNENTVNLLEASIHQHCQGSSNSHQLARSLRGWPMRPCVRSRVIWCDLKHRLTAFGSIAWPRARPTSLLNPICLKVAIPTLESSIGRGCRIGSTRWPRLQNPKSMKLRLER